MKLTEIKPNPENPRVIRDEKFKQLVKSIKDFPEMLKLRPLVIDENNIILGGNMRYRAMMEAGVTECEVIVAKNLTEEQKKEFVIKDNLSFGEWDWSLLANEWDNAKLAEWGLDVPVISDLDMNSFFEENENATENNHVIKLNYTEEEAKIVKEELLKHGKSYEQGVWKLLGL